MTAKTEPAKPAAEESVTGLALLRRPFPDHQISKLPKPTANQTRIVKDDFKKGVRCGLCNAWHHPEVVHLDYVGHAALTDRLLEADINWSWEPVAFGANGLPALDGNGGMWIRLTVCGVTRLGYGNAEGKSGGDAVKELIGDALRNAAMRFGAALDLWHKGDLHASDDVEEKPAEQQRQRTQPRQNTEQRDTETGPTLAQRAAVVKKALNNAGPDDLTKVWDKAAKLLAELSTSEPDLLAEITELYEARLDIPF